VVNGDLLGIELDRSPLCSCGPSSHRTRVLSELEYDRVPDTSGRGLPAGIAAGKFHQVSRPTIPTARRRVDTVGPVADWSNTCPSDLLNPRLDQVCGTSQDGAALGGR
jgi:hypothetical protein